MPLAPWLVYINKAQNTTVCNTSQTATMLGVILVVFLSTALSEDNFLDQGPVPEDHGPLLVQEMNTRGAHYTQEHTTPTAYPRSCGDIKHHARSNLVSGNYTIYDPTKYTMRQHGFHLIPIETFCEFGRPIRQRRAIQTSPDLAAPKPSQEPLHPRDCADIFTHHLAKNQLSKSGVYKIYNPLWYQVGPDGILPLPIYVYCDMVTAGGGWTVFQRRQDGSEDFYRNWYEYEHGFGKISGEHWLGLRFIQMVTDLQTSALHITMIDRQERETHAAYNGFGLGNLTTNYELKLGCYSGDDDKGDKLTRHKGKKFTTFDRDLDNDSGNCAVQRHGGYWYDKCTDSNLNGDYNATSGWSGICWGSESAQHHKSYVTMAFRPEHYK